MKRICIDARMWGIQHTGIGRYVESLIDYLPQDSNIEVVLIVTSDPAHEPKLAKYKKYYSKYHPYSYLAQFEFLWLLLQIRPDLLHVPHFTIPVLWWGKLVVTIHDLIKHMSKGRDTTTRHPLLYWLKYVQYLFIVWFAVKRADKIIVPAKYWKEILIHKYHLDPSKVIVTYEGVSDIYLNPPKKLPEVKTVSSPFLVYTGNLYPHKNIRVAIAAAEKLRMPLYIVCARSVFADRLPQSRYVTYLGRLSDEEVISLYKKATAFVFPSLIEGFGLPGLEAMAVGLPVMAAKASCLPEIYEDSVLFFDPQSSEDLIAKIKMLLNSSELRRELIAKGRAQVKKYSWAEMASQTWQIYQSALH